MLPPDHLVYLGHNENPGPDEDALRALPCAQFRADAVRDDPAGTASAALAAASRRSPSGSSSTSTST
jgi:hypothetical protein